MFLGPGTRLGQYEVPSPLGVSGMGEMYRARDANLGRDVALKVIIEATAMDAQRRARFEQKEHAIAALNHPNIVAVHDFGEQDGSLFIVTELIEGESLRTRIECGHLGSRETLHFRDQSERKSRCFRACGVVASVVIRVFALLEPSDE